MIDYESKLFEDEIRLLGDTGVAYIWCIYGRSKIDQFIKLLKKKGYKYKISWCGECCTVEKER